MAMQVTYEWYKNDDGDDYFHFICTGLNNSYNTTSFDVMYDGSYLFQGFPASGYLSEWTSFGMDDDIFSSSYMDFTIVHHYSKNGTDTTESASCRVYALGVTPGTEDGYILTPYEIADIESLASISVDIGARETHRYAFVPEANETITFTTDDATSGDNAGVYLLLSTSTTISSSTGVPRDYLVQDGGRNKNASISYDVSAGTTYYLYVQPWLPTGVLDCKILIEIDGGGGGGEVPSEWIVTPITISNISSSKSYELGFTYGKVIRYSLTFSKSGDVTFYTTGSEIDTIAYFAEASEYSLEFNTTDGTPGDWQYYNDDISSSNLNFSITAPVEANTTYYLYVRGINLESSGTCMLYIELEGSTIWTLSTDTWGQIDTSGFTISHSISAGYVYRLSVTFSGSGTATFYTSGSTYTYIYLSTSTGFDEDDGEPTSYKASDNGTNASVSYNVTTGTTYYLWVRASNISSSGSTSIGITFEASEPAGSAIIEKVSSTSSSITVRITGLDSSYSASDRTIYWYYGISSSSFTQSGTSSLSAGVSSSSNYTFSGLSSSATYYIYAKITFNNGSKTLDTVTLSTDAPSWSQVYVQTISNISNKKEISRSISAGSVYRYNLTFAESGTATFYSTGSINTYGSLSLASSFNASTGNPSSSEVSNDDGGDNRNFKFEYSVTAGTTYYLWVRAYSVTTSGSISVVIVPPGTRPSSFSWANTKTQGSAFNLTATEWNSLCDNINEVLTYKGYSTVSFTKAVKGNAFTATMFNECTSALKTISSTASSWFQTDKKAGDTINASDLNTIVELLNNVT